MEQTEVKIQATEFMHSVFGHRVLRLTGNKIWSPDIEDQLRHYKNCNSSEAESLEKELDYLQVFARDEINLHYSRLKALGVTVILIAPIIKLFTHIQIEVYGEKGSDKHPNGFNSGHLLMLANKYPENTYLYVNWSGGDGVKPIKGTDGYNQSLEDEEQYRSLL